MMGSMRVLEFLKKVLEAILSVVYPEEEWTTDELPRTEQAMLRGNNTEGLFTDVKRFERGAAFLWYKHNSLTARLIRRAKFGPAANPDILVQLTQEAAYDLLQTDFLEGIDLIIPVPLHPRRLRERGFNQSEIIARTLSRISGIPMDSTYLTRVRYNDHQVGLGGRARQKNVQRLFALNHPEELYHKHILLVDDVITTGNTLHACMKALEPTRDARFSVFALARAR